ncbi:MAG: YNFM family putative membrane transporter [Granulosicoccus sp.]|jgi:YNFM family putative membrane transporter
MVFGNSPPGLSFTLALLTTFVAFTALYAPQPLLPFFANEFSVTPTRVALLITVTLIGLAIAPLGIGVWLNRYSAQRLLVIATALLGILQLVFAAAPSFSILLAARIGQSLLYPAIFTAAVTYCSKQGAREALASRISLYVATTILGGLAGRLIGGYVSELTHWTTTFQLLGVLLLLCSASLFFAARDVKLPSTSGGTSWHAISAVLKNRIFIAGYLMIFLVFFAFVALLNALPFRMVAIDPDVAASRISLLYLGYLVGIIIAVFIKPLTYILGGEIRTLTLAMAIFLTGIALYGVQNISLMIGVGFLTSAGMFTVHTTLSSYLNSLKPESASIVNGLYISIYYSAGALGSLLPVALYHSFGWTIFLCTLLLSSSLALWPLLILRQSIARASC